MLNWKQISKPQQKLEFSWTLGNKIGGLATVLLILLGGVSSYFYFEINEISREIEEIGESDFPLYETTTQLILYQKEKQFLLEKLNYIYNYPSNEQRLYFSDIAYKFDQIDRNISRTLSNGIKQSQFALEEEQDKEDKIRLNQEEEDYQELKALFLQLELENKKFNLIIEQFLQLAISYQTDSTASFPTLEERNSNAFTEPLSSSLNLIQQARRELQAFDELILEIQQRLNAHIEGSVSATVDEKALAVKTNTLIAFGALLFGFFVSTLVTRQITSSVNKVTEQAKFIADNINRESLEPKELVIDTNDEIRDLSIAFNRMVKNFLNSQAERKQIAEQLLSEKELAQWQANHDALTGLVNRREFEHQLSQILSREETTDHTLLYLDLDRFKIVNDTCGHSAGDELLRQISKVLAAQVRSGDTLARLGGDEFAIILYRCSQQNAVVLAQRILSSVQKFCFLWHERSFTIGVSIGVLSFKSPEDTLTSVLKAADAACYSAKNLGRNQIYVMENKEQELAQQSQEMNWLAKIHQALDSDRFLLFYQTIQPLQTDSSDLEHYEVLLRMEGENGQIISPMAFIPIAERYQLMNRIDRWVIRTLFATQGSHYRKQGRICQSKGQAVNSLYTINLSGETLNDVNFVQFVKEQLERHRIPPQLICFEITETVAISNLSQAKLMISQLHELGCRFALDDFGSGMSSFGYLKSLPIDFLKIDGIFIRELLDDPINSAIIKSFHQVAQVMRIATIAEFVDSEDKLVQLQSLGIDYAQGYWIAKPQPFPKLQLLNSNQDVA